MFLVNLFEIVLGYAVLAMVFGCCPGTTFSDRIRAVYSSLRTAVTIGPINGVDDHVGCAVLYMLQIVEAYFITVLVIAGLLSAIERRETIAPKE